MGDVISLFEQEDFDFPFAGCKQCGCTDWKMLLSGDDCSLGIVGFQCSECGIVGLFDKNRDVIAYEMKDGE